MRIHVEWDPPSVDFGQPDVRTVPCEACQGEGRKIVASQPRQGDVSPDMERDDGQCEECIGTGKVDVVVGMVGCDDDLCPACGYERMRCLAEGCGF